MSGKKIGRKKKVYIACGGSAGHIFPALTLAEALLSRYGGKIDVSFLTSDDGLSQALFKKSGFNFYTLPLRRRKALSDGAHSLKSAAGGIVFALGLVRGYFESMKIILSGRPDCLVGFGAYVSAPPFLAAIMAGVPTLIHEQNAVMGKANKFMRHFATKVALSFPRGEDVAEGRRVVITGNPIRGSAARSEDRALAVKALGMDANKNTILVIGGSQGSRAVNSAALSAFKGMEKGLRDKMQIIHLGGEKDFEALKAEYKNADIAHRLFPFYDDMGAIYSAADIAISRAGASCVFELIAHGIPSILIPYPFAGSHQLQNAEFLARRQAAIIIEEKDIAGDTLRSAVVKLIEDAGLRMSIGKKMRAFACPDAAGKLADAVISLIG